MLMTIDRRSSLLGWISPGKRGIFCGRGQRQEARDLTIEMGPFSEDERGSYGREKERKGKGRVIDRRFADSAES